MSSSKKIIQKESLTAYQRWELPVVDENGENLSAAEVPRAAEEDVLQLPTVEQIEQIQKQAYDEAYKEGIAAGKQAGFQQGLDEGRDAGRRQGIEEGKKHMEEIGVRINGLLDFMTKPLDQLDERIEQELIALCAAMTKQLVRRELKIDSGHIVAALRQGIAILPVSARNIRVFLHPEDAMLVREAMAIGENVADARWRIVEDPALTRGGCHIESDESRIDLTVESRLMQIIAQVLGGEREGEK